MSKSFNIDHILYGNSQENSTVPPEGCVPWSSPSAMCPTAWTVRTAPTTTTTAPWFVQPVDLMTASLWTAAAAGSLLPHHHHQWIPPGWAAAGTTADIYQHAPSALLDAAASGNPFAYLTSAAGRSLLHSHQPSHQPTRKGGQIRFTHRQSNQLEETFSVTRYLTPTQRRALANRLALSERQVKTWFQNRRAKWRRTRKEGKLGEVDEEDEEISDDADEEHSMTRAGQQ